MFWERERGGYYYSEGVCCAGRNPPKKRLHDVQIVNCVNVSLDRFQVSLLDLPPLSFDRFQASLLYLLPLSLDQFSASLEVVPHFLSICAVHRCCLLVVLSLDVVFWCCPLMLSLEKGKNSVGDVISKGTFKVNLPIHERKAPARGLESRDRHGWR